MLHQHPPVEAEGARAAPVVGFLLCRGSDTSLSLLLMWAKGQESGHQIVTKERAKQDRIGQLEETETRAI